MTSMASNMAAHVKPIAHTPSDFLAQGFDLGFFYGAGFSRPLGPNEIKLGIPNDLFLVQPMTKPQLGF